MVQVLQGGTDLLFQAAVRLSQAGAMDEMLDMFSSAVQQYAKVRYAGPLLTCAKTVTV